MPTFPKALFPRRKSKRHGSLLEEIRNGALNESQPLGPVLRKCLVLSHRLHVEPLKTWVDLELNGYVLKKDFPDYRVARSHLLGDWVIGGNLVRNHPIPYVKNIASFREDMELMHLGQNIDEVSKLQDDGSLKSPVDAGVVALINHEWHGQAQCLDAWLPMPVGCFAAITGAVRSRLIEFTLQIEDDFPEVVTQDEVASPRLRERLSHTFITTIYGGSPIINVGGGTIHVQQIEQQVVVGSLDSLHQFFLDAGLEKDDLDQLDALVSNPDGIQRLVKEEDGWVRKAASKMTKGAKGVMFETAKEVVVQAILRYASWP